MRKFLLASLTVGLMAAASLAQSRADYSGTWELDKDKSTFAGPRMTVEGMTLNVTQTDKEIKVDTAIKRMAPPDGAGAPTADAPSGAPGRGPRGRRGMGMGDSSATYSLDGKETKAEVDGPMGRVPVIYKGSVRADGSLELSSSRTVGGQMGDMTLTTKETWKLSADGKTLTIDRLNSTPRGEQTSKLVFVKG